MGKPGHKVVQVLVEMSVKLHTPDEQIKGLLRRGFELAKLELHQNDPLTHGKMELLKYRELSRR